MKKFVLFAASAIVLLAACNSSDDVVTSIDEGNPQV
ncbi:MAG: lipoprotein, partial [Bacteroidaceae bacterium]|nr:lipoprotein [Bacteroidaceae bacterium]